MWLCDHLKPDRKRHKTMRIKYFVDVVSCGSVSRWWFSFTPSLIIRCELCMEMKLVGWRKKKTELWHTQSRTHTHTQHRLHSKAGLDSQPWISILGFNPNLTLAWPGSGSKAKKKKSKGIFVSWFFHFGTERRGISSRSDQVVQKFNCKGFIHQIKKCPFKKTSSDL